MHATDFRRDKENGDRQKKFDAMPGGHRCGVSSPPSHIHHTHTHTPCPGLAHPPPGGGVLAKTVGMSLEKTDVARFLA